MKRVLEALVLSALVGCRSGINRQEDVGVVCETVHKQVNVEWGEYVSEERVDNCSLTPDILLLINDSRCNVSFTIDERNVSSGQFLTEETANGMYAYLRTCWTGYYEDSQRGGSILLERGVHVVKAVIDTPLGEIVKSYALDVSGYYQRHDSVLFVFEGDTERHVPEFLNMLLSCVQSINDDFPGAVQQVNVAPSDCEASYTLPGVYLSGSLFQNNPESRRDLCDIVNHEGGHGGFLQVFSLNDEKLAEFRELYKAVSQTNLITLFIDGNFTPNRHHGHPWDGPFEFFASAYMIMKSGYLDQFRQQAGYVSASPETKVVLDSVFTYIQQQIDELKER